MKTDFDDWSMFDCLNICEDIPKIACVYFLFNDDELVYIGQTKNLRTRVMYHNSFLNPNIYVGSKKVSNDIFNKVFFKVEDDKSTRVKLEKEYYEAYDPKLNFNGVFSPYMYLNQARAMEYRLKMGLEKRYEL